MKNKRTKTEVMIMNLLVGLMSFSFWMMNGISVCAEGIIEGAAKGALNEIFWGGVIVLAITLIFMMAKRAWIAAGTTLLLGSFVLAWIKKPELVESIGERVFQIFNLAG